MKRYREYLILTLVLVLISAWIIWPTNPGVHFSFLNKDFKTQLGLDLVGGIQALLEADLPADQEIDTQQMNTAKKIVENRVNGLGVTEALVQQAGNRRIVVELPGETDPDKALAALKQTGLLEFVDMTGVPQSTILDLQNSKTKITTDLSLSTSEPISSTETVYKTVLTGANLEDAGVTTNESGGYEVAMKLDPEGTTIFKDFTSNHINDVLAIVLDKQIISAPAIQNVIPNGQAVITGNFTYDEANALAVQLRYGALPVPLKIIESRLVGPTLGKESLQKSLIAGLIGFSIVILFMGIYYRVPGLIADISIIIYAIFAFAVFRFIPVTLTLPGIAGFLLSTGSALDANILIFERMKDEIREGRTISQAMDQGWRRAWTSIRDSNIATLITCAILFWFSSQFGATIVKGFSVSLFIGVIISLFVAIVVTRALLSLLFRVYTPSNVSKWFGL